MKFINFGIKLMLAALINNSPALAEETCTNVPADAANAAVKACESANNYIFHINGEVLTYDKKSYQNELRGLLWRWLNNTYLTKQNIGSTQLDLILSVPELNPSATQMRIVANSTKETFVAFMSLRPEEWSLDALNVSILEKNESYPDVYGYKARSILIQKSTNVDSDPFKDHLESFGITNIEAFSEDWYRANTEPFGEMETISQVKSAWKSALYITEIQTNSMVEWISLRQKVFSFKLEEPQY